jgi:hypothetical protein
MAKQATADPAKSTAGKPLTSKAGTKASTPKSPETPQGPEPEKSKDAVSTPMVERVTNDKDRARARWPYFKETATFSGRRFFACELQWNSYPIELDQLYQGRRLKYADSRLLKLAHECGKSEEEIRKDLELYKKDKDKFFSAPKHALDVPAFLMSDGTGVDVADSDMVDRDTAFRTTAEENRPRLTGMAVEKAELEWHFVIEVGEFEEETVSDSTIHLGRRSGSDTGFGLEIRQFERPIRLVRPMAEEIAKYAS